MLAALAILGPPPPAAAQARDFSVEICLRCHGPSGLAGHPAVPDLGNQRLAYLQKQIDDFRQESAREALIVRNEERNFTGRRSHPDMDAFTGLIAPADTDRMVRALVGAECRQAPSPPGHTISRPLAKPPLAERCTACHGTRGADTINALVPRIYGQSRTYLAAQLFAMRRADRTSGAGSEGASAMTLRSHPIMNAVAAGLSNEDIRAIADYLSIVPCK